ncbi:hypothetical protein Nmel_006572 [Mimus melanotis]
MCAKNKAGGNDKERKGKAEPVSGSQAPCQAPSRFLSAALQTQQGQGSGKTTATPGPPVPPHFSYFPAQIEGCCGGRGWAGMAVRAVLLLGLLLLSHQPGDTAILEANGNRSCRCLKSTRAFIPPAKYSSVEVWPVGSSCRRPEVVLTLKKNKRVCVTPEAPWIQLLIHKLTQRNGPKKALPRPRREALCCPWRNPTPSLPLSTSKESTVMNSSWDSNDTTPLP